jgi:hypothetical protein
MPKKGKGITDEERSKRFIDAARKAEVDETGEEMERAFGKVVPPKRPSTKRRDEPR